MDITDIHKIIDVFYIFPNSASSSAGSMFSDIFKSLVAPALVAVFFTGFTNYFLEVLKVKREAVSNLSAAIRQELTDLQNLNAEYWSSPQGDNDAPIEAKIMSALESVSTGLRAFQKDRKVKLSDNLDTWIISLRDQVTGGDFQTSGRFAEFNRVQSVTFQITKMKYKIFEERLRKM